MSTAEKNVAYDPAVLEAARQYRKRGWKPIPVPGRLKNPTDNGWQNEDYGDGRFMPWHNIGIQFGACSNGLCDVDLDCEEVLELADDYLPKTEAMFGRKSKPRAHRLYYSDLHESDSRAFIQFPDPTEKPKTAMLIELRTGGSGKGAQSMFPPSTHPDSQQAVRWDSDGEPRRVKGSDLKRCVADLAAAALLLRYYPSTGLRDKAAMAIGGMLARADWSAQDIEEFFAPIVRAAGDEEAAQRVQAAVRSIDRLNEGKETTGYPKVAEIWGDKVASKVCDWLDLERGNNKSSKTTSTHCWDEPDVSLLDDRRGELPDFPLDVFSPEWLRNWLPRAAHGAGTSIDHVAVPLLGIASGLIGTARRVKPNPSWSEPITLWCGTVGYSGDGKTPGLNVSKNCLDMVESQREPENERRRREHEQDVEYAEIAHANWKKACREDKSAQLIRPPKPAAADKPPPFYEPRLYTSDTTIEALAMLILARPSGLMMINDELAGWLNNMRRYAEKGDDRAFWLKAWDAKSHQVDRKNSPPIKLKHLLVGIIGGLQPDKFATCFKGDSDGLYARFLWSWPQPAPYRPLTDDIEEIDSKIVKMFAELATLSDGEPRRIIMLTDKARRGAFEAVRTRVSAGVEELDGREKEWWSKIPAHVLRLAGTLASMECALRDAELDEILPRDIERAACLVFDYFWPHACACLRQIGITQHDADARRVLRWLKAKGRDEISREDIRCQALARRLNADQTEAVLEQLVRAGWLRRASTETTGRPQVRWLVNPKLL
jgi:hypothetical protein